MGFKVAKFASEYWSKKKKKREREREHIMVMFHDQISKYFLFRPENHYMSWDGDYNYCKIYICPETQASDYISLSCRPASTMKQLFYLLSPSFSYYIYMFSVDSSFILVSPYSSFFYLLELPSDTVEILLY